MSESPLDELRIPADKLWEKIMGGDMPTLEELQMLVDYERAARQAWIKKESQRQEEKGK
jgi:hypothetical protein